MIKIKILSVGKHKHSWLESALSDYEKRLTGTAQLEWLLYKGDDKLIDAALQCEKFICLDPKGAQMSSEQFSTFIIEKGARLTFIIGGAEGLPPILKEKASNLISFSKLTFTHQITRLVLCEQLYRAFEINKNSLYHK